VDALAEKLEPAHHQDMMSKAPKKNSKTQHGLERILQARDVQSKLRIQLNPDTLNG